MQSNYIHNDIVDHLGMRNSLSICKLARHNAMDSEDKKPTILDQTTLSIHVKKKLETEEIEILSDICQNKHTPTTPNKKHKQFVLYKSQMLTILINDINIHKRDTRSVKIRTELDTYFVELFKIIEETRDEFYLLAFKYLKNDAAVRELLEYLELMQPLEILWTDLITRCTETSKTPTKNAPFNYNFATYKGHFITLSSNGKVKLRIPIRVRMAYVRELIKIHQNMSEYLSNFRIELENVLSLNQNQHQKEREEKEKRTIIIKFLH